jgi:hypothetical protein
VLDLQGTLDRKLTHINDQWTTKLDRAVNEAKQPQNSVQV